MDILIRGLSMNKTVIYIFLFFLLLLMSFFPYYLCGLQVKCKDISHDEQYTHLIGQKDRSVRELLIYGITADRNYKKQIDYYVVTEAPGIGGPEVLSEGHLALGTVIQIKKALHCAYFLDPSIEFQIEILSEEKYHDHPVRIRENTMGSSTVKIWGERRDMGSGPDKMGSGVRW